MEFLVKGRPMSCAELVTSAVAALSVRSAFGLFGSSRPPEAIRSDLLASPSACVPLPPRTVVLIAERPG